MIHAENLSENQSPDAKSHSRKIKQFTTFTLGDHQYGIDVMRVQEVTNSLPLTQVPLAPKYVRGLINLRGQIATAIGLHDLFGFEAPVSVDSNMTLICRVDGALLSLLVDSIGDVVDIPFSDYEPVPDTIKGSIRKFMSGVYKTQGTILSIIDLDQLTQELNLTNET